jgi:hypothetical protein
MEDREEEVEWREEQAKGIFEDIGDYQVTVKSTKRTLSDGTCPFCKGLMVGDGYREVIHCENAKWKDYRYLLPEDSAIYCRVL